MPKKTLVESDRIGLSVLPLFQMFPDETLSRKWFEDIRWPNGERYCPRCGSLKTALVPNKEPYTNDLESFCAMRKRRHKGAYHKISAEHLHRYVTEFAGRHNARDLDTITRVTLLTKGPGDRRLRHNDLAASHG